jgi:hypothetical protein
MKISDSYQAAQKFDTDYYHSMGREERLETVQLLREIYFKIKKGSANESRKRLRRTVQILKQT